MENETLVWPVIVPSMLDAPTLIDEHALDAMSYAALLHIVNTPKPIYRIRQDAPAAECFCAYCMSYRTP